MVARFGGAAADPRISAVSSGGRYHHSRRPTLKSHPMTTTRHGLAVLVRSSQAVARPATIRDVVSGGRVVTQSIAPLEAAADRMNWLRVGLVDSGHEALIRAANRLPPGIATTVGDEIGDRIGEINASWNRLQREITHARSATPPQVTQPFYVSFLTDYQTWSRFNADHAGGTGMTSDETVLLGQIEQHRLTLERWRTAFQQVGGVTQGSPTQALPPGRMERLTEALGPGGITRVAEAASSTAAAIGFVAVAAVVALVVIEGGSLARRVT